MKLATITTALLLLVTPVLAQVPRGTTPATPTTTVSKAQIDKSLATDPNAWRDSNGNLPPPVALTLGMNPADPAAARAYVLWTEAKTDRTALAQLNVAVETHRRAIERLERSDPMAVRDALAKSGLAPDQFNSPAAQFALAEALKSEQGELAKAEAAFQERRNAFQAENAGQ